jgi:hypothetical protein
MWRRWRSAPTRQWGKDLIGVPETKQGVLVAGRHSYGDEGRSLTLTVRNGRVFGGPWAGSAVAREYEPRGRPDRPHVYLITPIYPTTTSDVRLHLGLFVAELAEAFDLTWHTASWPSGAVVCGIVLAATGEATTRVWGVVDLKPGLRIPISWIREPGHYEMRDLAAGLQVAAADVVACLGHRLPLWPAGTHDAASVAAWRPETSPLSHAIPHDLANVWRICQYAAEMAAKRPGEGFVELATASHEHIARVIWNRVAGDTTSDAAWKAAVSVAIPPVPPLPSPEDVSLLNATNVLHGSQETPPAIASEVYRVFGDPTRGAPVIVRRDINGLPHEVIATVLQAPTIAATTPRHQRLVAAAEQRYPSPTWQLRQDSNNNVDHLYAISDDHLAWLPAGEWLYCFFGRGLLPAKPHELLLVRDNFGALGGWVSGIDGTYTPLPYAGTPGDPSVALAEIVTGRSLDYAHETLLDQLLYRLPRDSAVVCQWATIELWANEFPAGRPPHGGPLSFRISGQSLASVPAPRRTLPRFRSPAPRRLQWEDFDPKAFEDLICQLANSDPRYERCTPHGGSGHYEHGVDGVGRMRQPTNPDRPYVAIQCKRHKTFEPHKLRAAIQAFKRGVWLTKTDTLIIAFACDITSPRSLETVREAETDLAAQHGVRLEIWTGFELSTKLRQHHELVSRYFSRYHADEFCDTPQRGQAGTTLS